MEKQGHGAIWKKTPMRGKGREEAFKMSTMRFPLKSLRIPLHHFTLPPIYYIHLIALFLIHIIGIYLEIPIV